MHPAINIATKAARRAAQIINRASNDVELLKVESKSTNDFVTEVDRAAEATIIQTLKEAYPAYGILAEESGQTPGSREAGKNGGADAESYQWIIDPLDGTPISSTVFPSTRFPLPWPRAMWSSKPLFTTPIVMNCSPPARAGVLF